MVWKVGLHTLVFFPLIQETEEPGGSPDSQRQKKGQNGRTWAAGSRVGARGAGNSLSILHVFVSRKLLPCFRKHDDSNISSSSFLTFLTSFASPPSSRIRNFTLRTGSCVRRLVYCWLRTRSWDRGCVWTPWTPRRRCDPCWKQQQQQEKQQQYQLS